MCIMTIITQQTDLTCYVTTFLCNVKGGSVGPERGIGNRGPSP